MPASSLLSDFDLSVSFGHFLQSFRDKLDDVFGTRVDADRMGLRRGMPPFLLREVQMHTPLSVFIPSEYGGRGGHPRECQAVLAAASYESLALSLMIGINGALFIQPVAKYGTESVRRRVFERFLGEKTMGGLMITEPDYGSDALNMQTAYEPTEDGYHLEGTKHWAGLTGWADYWLVTARKRAGEGLGRDIDFFVVDVSQPEQRVEVEEVYENLGLYMLPYGLNRISAEVPEDQRLQPRSNGIMMMLDLLHRSRIQFPGMGMGFLQRMVDEALAHCRERFVGGLSLLQYDQVQSRIARMQAYYTTCSALCAQASEHASLDRDLTRESLRANATKSVITDMMQEAAQSLLQLVGAKGYRLDHIAGRALVDSRPFQIFEGSNDILYQQISEAVLKGMRKAKAANLQDYLAGFELSERASQAIGALVDFEVDMSLPQRKLVELGRVLGRIFSMEQVIELGERGFRADLVGNALSVLRGEVEALVGAYRRGSLVPAVEDYHEGSSWLSYVE